MYPKLVCAFLLAVSPALQDNPNGWEIGEIEQGCYAARTYSNDGATTYLSVGKTLDGRSIMIITNHDWSIEEGKIYDVYVVIGDSMFEGQAHGGPGRSLVFNLKPGLIEAFAKGKDLIAALKMDENTEKVLAAFKLTGSTKAVDRIDICMRRLAEKKRRLGLYPLDPFKP